MRIEVLIGIVFFSAYSCVIPKETSTSIQDKNPELGLDSLEQARTKRVDSMTIVTPKAEIKSNKISIPEKKVQKKKSGI